MFAILDPSQRMEYIRFHYGCYLHGYDKENIINMHSKYIHSYSHRKTINKQMIIEPANRKMMVAMVDYFP